MNTVQRLLFLAPVSTSLTFDSVVGGKQTHPSRALQSIRIATLFGIIFLNNFKAGAG